MKKGKKKWLIVLAAVAGALGMAAETGLLPAPIADVASQALDAAAAAAGL